MTEIEKHLNAVTVKDLGNGFEQISFVTKQGETHPMKLEAAIQFIQTVYPSPIQEAVNVLLTTYMKNGEAELDRPRIIAIEELLYFLSALWQAEEGVFIRADKRQ
jgi:hypothetical protein